MALIEKLQSFIALSRPTQIIKHTTIFVALILSQWVSHLVYWQQTFFGFLALWLTGACAYAINDLFDAKLDAANPRTKDRPIASNKISKSEAIWFIRLT
ncbi:MAG TPA: UbiA family prenyltransferase, partial [Acidobacteriota bacterium]|nr:UbiA family prenyltransferase [Acidobacteriota bacterium]